MSAPGTDDTTVVVALDALVLSATLLASYGYHQAAQDTRELVDAFVATARRLSGCHAPVMTDSDVRDTIAELRRNGL